MRANTNAFKCLSPFNEKGELNVIIETPKGSRNKYKYDTKQNVFMLAKVLPAGIEFPYDFGYIPSTKGDDGDPLDVMILMDESVFPGCLVTARLIGVIKGEQIEDGKKLRNDRLIAVASHAHDQGNLHSIDELDHHLLKELEQFFEVYHALDGNEFKSKKYLGPEKAKKLVYAGVSPKMIPEIKRLVAHAEY